MAPRHVVHADDVHPVSTNADILPRATSTMMRPVGVGGDVALSLALAKRMRELVPGVPALLSWHWFETVTVRRYVPRDT